MKKVCIALGFITISTICVMNTSFSRYFSQVSSTSNISVAIPQIELENVNTAFVTGRMIPGETRTIEFDVKNFKNADINEVLMQYYIDLNIETNTIPFTYEIYQVNGTNEVKLNKTASGFGPVQLGYGSQETKHFKLVISWAETDNNVSYADQQFQFRIAVNAEQVI